MISEVSQRRRMWTSSFCLLSVVFNVWNLKQNIFSFSFVDTPSHIQCLFLSGQILIFNIQLIATISIEINLKKESNKRIQITNYLYTVHLFFRTFETLDNPLFWSPPLFAIVLLSHQQVNYECAVWYNFHLVIHRHEMKQCCRIIKFKSNVISEMFKAHKYRRWIIYLTCSLFLDIVAKESFAYERFFLKREMKYDWRRGKNAKNKTKEKEEEGD